MREQARPADLHVLFAPLKHARLDYLVQKAVEMGASRLQPVITRHTQVARVNLERMRANAIEAAQQCGILTLPEVAEPVPFKTAAGNADTDRLLVFCDEDAEVKDPVAALAAARPMAKALLPAEASRAANPLALPLAVLIGPEGGFANEEREALLMRPNMVRIALGPRILETPASGARKNLPQRW
jgi:16S rRNA (uracil1498-N3)-methyltransferase